MIDSKTLLILLFFIWSERVFAQDPPIRINEVGRSNGLTDEDGDHVGWLELYNPTDSIVNFGGYYLTDSKQDPTKWKFQLGSSQIIEPHGYRLVYLSGKDRPDSNSAEETQRHVIGYWPFNGSAVDYSRNNNNGIVNGPVPSPGRYGRINGAFRFDGIDDFIEFSPRSYLPFDSNFTISYWSNTALSFRQHALSFGTAAGNNIDFDYADGTGLLAYWNSSGGNSLYTAGESNELNDGRWHHIVLNRDSGLVKLFVDGTLRGSVYYPDSIASYNIFRMGRGSYYPGYWTGSLDDLVILDSAYSPMDVPAFRLHSNFSITQSELTLYLIKPDQNTVADTMYIHSLPEGVSVGLSDLQLGGISYFTNPTPGYENGSDGISFELAQDSVFINEVVTNQDSVIKDDDGVFSPYVEIINVNSGLIDLGGMILQYSGERWSLPDRSLLPGTRQIVWLDGKNRAPISGELHSSFSISSSGGMISLFKSDGVTEVDSIQIPFLLTNQTFARVPDGFGQWKVLHDATPSAYNIKLSINEIQTINETGIADNQGMRWPWLEIYNNTHDTIQLKHFFLTNDTANYQKWKFPDAAIPPFGFRLIFLSARDTITSDGVFHTNFTINQSYQKFIMSDSLFGRITGFEVPFVSTDKSYGRMPDASVFQTFFDIPTPGVSNTQGRFTENVSSQNVKGVWQKVLNNGPFTPRDGAAMVEFKGKLWLLGGWRGTLGVCSEVWSSPDGINWTMEVAEAPWNTRHTHGCVVFQDKIWLMSGDGNADVWNSADGVNWTKLTETAPWGRRYAPYVAVFNNEIWLMGGESWWDSLGNVNYNNTVAFNDVWKTTDGVNWTLVSPNAPWDKRALIHGRVVFDNKLWIMGGGIKNISGGDIAYNDIWYTSNGMAWTKVTDNAPWQKRDHFSVTVYDDKMWVTDGSALPVQQNLLNDAWYSPDGLNWFNVISDSTFPTRHASSLGVFKNNLYLMCGYLHNDVWTFSFLRSNTSFLNYDSTEFKSSTPLSARIYNLSITPEIVDSVRFTTGHFSIENVPLHLNPLDSGEVLIQFSPQVLGNIIDTAVVYSCGGTIRIPVSGIGSHTNHAPVFVGDTTALAWEDSLFQFHVYAQDQDSAYFSDSIRYRLLSGPSWIMIDTTTGIVSGIPDASFVGSSSFEIEARDKFGGIVNQVFSVNVLHRNHFPYWVNRPDTLAFEDSLYQSRIYARDQDSLFFGDLIRFRFIQAPDWLSIDSLSGYLSGTPGAMDIGDGDTIVSLAADDGKGGVIALSILLLVHHVNHAPIIQTSQLPEAYEDSLFSNTIHASDADSAIFGDRLKYHLVIGPWWLSMDSSNGLLQGVPSAVCVGDTVVKIAVTDGQLDERREFSLSIIHINHAPVFVSEPDSIAKVDSLYLYRARASDKDSLLFGDNVYYRLEKSPQWMTIDSLSGIISGVPSVVDIGHVEMTISANDGRGGAVYQNWHLRVYRAFRPPTPVAVVDPQLGDTLTLFKIPENLIFSWHRSYDPDPYDTMMYSFRIYGNGLDTAISSLRDTVVRLTDALFTENSTYHWTIQVSDGYFEVSSMDTFDFHTTRRFSKSTFDSSPQVYFLFQNYPNPFNPTTTFRFQIPEESDVGIVVYNILGQKVQTVIRKRLQAKYYEIDWHASGLANGIYFLTMRANSVVSNKTYFKVRKIVLLK